MGLAPAVERSPQDVALLDKRPKSNWYPGSEVSPVQVCRVLTREQRGLPGAALWQTLDAERRVERNRQA